VSVAPVTSQTPPTPTATLSTAASPTSHLGAIVGGAVGGAIAIALIIAALLWRSRQQKSQPFPPTPSTEDSHFFRYNPVPARRPSEAFVEAKQLENASSPALSQMTPPRVYSPDNALLPNRHGPNHPPPGIRILEANPQPTQLPRLGLERQTSFATTNMSLSEQPSTINMHALANEVATLLRTPSAGNLGQPVVPNPEGPRPRNKLLDGRNGDLSMNRNNESSPPAYRTTMQTPDRSSG
jgi:FtsZ-interacting cell division protein ZipA